MGISIISKEITHKGKIIIATRINQEFYDYTTGMEAFAYDRIAEELYDLVCDSDVPPGGVVMNLDHMIPIGAERSANHTPSWLVINITSLGNSFVIAEEFENYLTLTVVKIVEKLINDTKGDRSWKAIIEADGKKYHIIQNSA